jgi:DNA-directed RNA polymerase beta' subunit
MLQHRFKNICYDEITSDNIVEVNEFFGITFARNKIISEIMMFDDELAEMHPKHLMIVADEITQSGILSKINRTSISGRTTNPLHNIANCGVSRILENAAKKGQRADVHGISPKFLVGDIPNVGTTYNEIGLDINRYHELLNSGKKNDEDNL